MPVPHHQSQNFVGFFEAAELAGVRHFAAENLTGHLTRCVGAGMRGWPLGERWRSPKTVRRCYYAAPPEGQKRTAPSHLSCLKMESNLQKCQFYCLFKIAHSKDHHCIVFPEEGVL